MPILDALDLPQLYMKPSAEALLKTLALLKLAPRSWDRNHARLESAVSPEISSNTRPTDCIQIDQQAAVRYLTSIVGSSLQWITSDEAKEDIWTQASQRLSERSGRSGMGAITRTFRIPSSTEPCDLSIHEPALTEDDLGLKTWAASYLLAKRLTSLDLLAGQLTPRRVLELGSGTGLVGMAMAALGADVTLTDLPSIYPNLSHNVAANAEVLGRNGGSVQTGILDWSDPVVCSQLQSSAQPSRFPIILAADSLYSPDHPRMFVNAIETWLSDDAEARVIVELPLREAYLPQVDDFRSRMEAIGLCIVDEGEETGLDDWGYPYGTDQDDDDDGLVRCWWSCWQRRGP